eukprot:COSAG06_NODE_3845_length_4841_cov_17.994095_3_plen_70_part_00
MMTIYLFIGAGSGADTAAAAAGGGGDAAEMRGVLKKDYAPSFDTAIGGTVSFLIEIESAHTCHTKEREI